MAGCQIIYGGRHADARGALRFCNDFDMAPVRRFYQISNSAEAPVRGWIGHRKETKWFFPEDGVTTIVVRSMDGDVDDRKTFVLDSSNPQVLCVSPGHWFSIEQHDGARVTVYSNCRVHEFENDDFRCDITNP